MSTYIVPRFEMEARRIAGDLAEQIVAELLAAAEALDAQFARYGIEVDITVGTEAREPAFRVVVAWTRGRGAESEPWDQVISFPLSRMLELHRTVHGDAGLVLAERWWNGLVQFEVPERRARAG
jgi:hypothetical protein